MTAKPFDRITACLDMAGCPNRCKHCWLGHTANGSLGKDDLRFVAREFRPFTEKLEVASWYREPDYQDDYKELWALESELSDSVLQVGTSTGKFRTKRMILKGKG